MALRPPGSVLAALAAALKPARSSAAGLRFETPERYHLTLQFLGAVREVAPVVETLAVAAGSQPSLRLRLGGAGAFPKPGSARVVWVGAAGGGDEVAGLARFLAGALRPLGYEPDRGSLHPHLTVARLKVPADVSWVLDAIGGEPVGEAFTVGEIELYRSDLSSAGSNYTLLERFPLRGA